MSVIWKYELEMKMAQKIELPKGAQVLTVATQFERPCIWAIVEPSEPMEERTFGIATTGEHFAAGELSSQSYLGTFMLAGGTFVGHLFERKP